MIVEFGFLQDIFQILKISTYALRLRWRLARPMEATSNCAI